MIYRKKSLIMTLLVGAMTVVLPGTMLGGGGELECKDCEEGYWACWAVTDVSCLPGYEWTPIYAHRFSEGGGGGANFAALTSLVGDGEIDVENVGPRACGGTSECHSDPQNGSCHVECQGGGGAALVAMEVEDAVSIGDVASLLALVQREKIVNLRAGENVVEVMSACATEEVWSEIPVSSEIATAIGERLER